MTDHLRSPRAVALLGQLDAANSYTLRNLVALVPRLGAELTELSPPPALRRILARLDARLKTGGVTLCRHLSANAPVLTW